MTFADDESTSKAARKPGAAAGFTIRGLMVAIAIAACLLAMPRLFSIAILVAAPAVAPAFARRMLERKERKPAAYSFAVFAAAISRS
jgi:hypothetical protein